jgi:uncharacterized cofD-like protein
LASDDGPLAQALEYRFEEGTLVGHPVGKLLLIWLALSGGDLQAAVDEVGRLVGAEGRVIPASEVPVTLIADSDEGTLAGEVTIERASGIRNLRFDPAAASSPSAAVAAIEEADQIVIGPGSLFTSVLATAVMPDILSALGKASGQRVFVANVANEKGDARGFGLNEHIETLIDHAVGVDVVLTAGPVTDEAPDGGGGSFPRIVSADVADQDGWSHDPTNLGRALQRLYEQR